MKDFPWLDSFHRRNTGRKVLAKVLQAQFLQLVKNRAHVIRPSRPVKAALDGNDDKFLECAEEARADYLITGNRRHFPRFWKSTKIVNAREFVSLAAPHLG